MACAGEAFDAADFLAEARSLAYHSVVARRIAERPVLMARAKGRIDAWLAAGSIAEPYGRRWQELLGLPVEELAARLVSEGEEMTALRQCSPFAGALEPRERWRIHREVGDAYLKA